MTQEKIVSAPPTFTDSEKRVWTIKLNLSLLDAVQANCQVDLTIRDLKTDHITNLLFEHRSLGNVLWECCQHQAKDKGVDRDSFFQALDADALSAGWGALVDGIVFFIQQTQGPKMAQAVNELVEKQMALVERGAATLVETLKSRETDEKLKQKFDEIAKSLQGEMNRTLDNFATNSAE